MSKASTRKRPTGLALVTKVLVVRVLQAHPDDTSERKIGYTQSFGEIDATRTRRLPGRAVVARVARMSSTPVARAMFLASFVSVTAFATAAAAHISLEQGGTHMSRYGDGSDKLKAPPCGVMGGKRGTNVYTYEGGETITVSLVEYIPHPSYFRFAFDDDGDDDFQDPASIEPIDPMRACPLNAADQCGAPDYYNNATVLPMMDDLDPHLAEDSKHMYTWDVKLPNVECDNCTLQVIQVMEDTIHGAYDIDVTDPAGGLPDVYHQCIDLVLHKTADTEGTPPKKPAAEPKADSSGCTVSHGHTTGGTALAVAALALAVTSLRRRGRAG
jgi:hypothetical protein